MKIVGRVDALPSGRYRFRTEIGGKTTSESFDMRDEATAYQLAVSRELAKRGDRPRHRQTLAEYAAGWFSRRRSDGDVRDLDGEIRRWDTHVETTKLGSMPLVEITAASIKGWFRDRCASKIHYPYAHPRNGKTVSKSTIKKALVILRLCLDEAVEDGKIASNPARSFKLKRGKTTRTHEPWTYLEPHEQSAIMALPNSELSDMIGFALGTGMRQGEQWNQQIADVFPDRIVVRYGSAARATKSGKVRTIPLFGVAARAVKSQLARLADRPNPLGLLWPSPRGKRREKGKLPHGWKAICARLLVPATRHDQRSVRWHDLRHTCASSLVAGWWGRIWSLQHVRDLLGHSSITVTEKYAHLAASALNDAARETVGPDADLLGSSDDQAATPSQPRHDDADPSETADRDALLTRRSRVRVPFDPPRKLKAISAIERSPRDGVVTAALAYAEAAADASPDAYHLACVLAEAVLDRADVKLALDVLDGAPTWAASALRLAEHVVDDDRTCKDSLQVRHGGGR